MYNYPVKVKNLF